MIIVKGLAHLYPSINPPLFETLATIEEGSLLTIEARYF